MLGAIIGDIVGSTREHHNIKTEDFKLIPDGSRFTDDTVMTLAVAQWLMSDPEHREETLIECMQRLGRKYPDAGYGGLFRRWLASDRPEPYGSFGNGSAMRVSPVGLYARSLDEALELARLTAAVTHNHPEGIKGAQAIAACVYLYKQSGFEPEKRAWIKNYFETAFGYNLDIKLEDIRGDYSFDVTCQGSVPVAIMAFLQRVSSSAEAPLRLAISMGGDSDTIGSMTCAIASASRSVSSDVEKKCRALLPAELLDINDRFEAFISRPLFQSYVIDYNLYAGEYPGNKNGETAEKKVKQMVHFGIKHFIDLTEEHELRPYIQCLPAGVTYTRFPIPDCGVPRSVEKVHRLIDRIDDLLNRNDGAVYLHCWGGVGRTGTIVACYLARHSANPTPARMLKSLRELFSAMPKSACRVTPETRDQMDFVKNFVDSCPAYKEEQAERIHDSIRGSLMAGAAGDALGYPVEFMSCRSIISRYGERGITSFELDRNGQALVSDDTQMTLFTANGMLMGITRGAMRGIGGNPEFYVDGAYLDWYYTQTGRKKEGLSSDFHYTWLRDLPQLAHRRAPGCTCLSACECLLRQEKVTNSSKGCGGIMRVAPMGLMNAARLWHGFGGYSLNDLAVAGAEIARVTHKHPLGFLPAALLTVLLNKLVPRSVCEVKETIGDIVGDTLAVLDTIYPGEYECEKSYLKQLTERAVELANSEMPDNIAIRELGEGWTGEEAWAIALYCSLRHTGSLEEAIIASVNHDGDSDSTGSITGNIMGAIYGYKTIRQRRLFCPADCELESTLELSEIILALADDLMQGCIISEYAPLETPEQQQWYARYCEMKPAGISVTE